MAKRPMPKPVDPTDVAILAKAEIDVDRFPYLATIDGAQPRVRPVSPVRTNEFMVYVANLRSSQKTHEPAADPKWSSAI